MIEIIDLSFSYDESYFVLNSINLRIKKGEFVSILGANGSGKSTLALCISGLLNPLKGSILVDGEKPATKASREKTGILFQNPDNQILTSIMERELAFTLENFGLSYSKMHEKVSKTIKRFNLDKYKNRNPEILSGGEKQKIALASVLISDPNYLILDEPFSLLPPRSQSDIMELLQEYKNVKDKTVILITQFPKAALLSDRIITLEDGGIGRINTPEVIFKDPEYLKRIGIRPLKTNHGGILS
ncbi:ATP-binding cassette domain-containing protein [candidate division KSB1 bacterium]